jgi:F-type H+-transporting ATPase subunit b
VLKAVVTVKGGSLVDVALVSAEEGEGPYKSKDCEYPEKDENGNVIKDAEGKSVCLEGPSPIMPESKELAWGAGAFVVFALLMRYVLYPRLKKGTDARYASIRSGHESAESARSSARREVADYEAALASVKAEAAARVDTARATVDQERLEAIAAANTRISAKRDRAASEAEAARLAVRSEIEGAVASVATRVVELTVGRVPDAAVVSRAVADAMSAGVQS